MRNIQIVLRGKNEEQIAQTIMGSIYAALQQHGYCDVSVEAKTEPEPPKELMIPRFIRECNAHSTPERKRG